MYLNKKNGKFGEKLAINYLIKKGYKILENNYYTKYGEIDIIAKKDKYLVFIEVKTRSNNHYGSPIEAINYIKQMHLIKSIKYYLYKNKIINKPIRIDGIEVYLIDKYYRINHIKQII